MPAQFSTEYKSNDFLNNVLGSVVKSVIADYGNFDKFVCGSCMDWSLVLDNVHTHC